MKASKDGFNLYRNGKFWMIISWGEDENKTIERIKDYVEVNNFDISEFSYKQYKNNNSDNFKLKTITI